MFRLEGILRAQDDLLEEGFELDDQYDDVLGELLNDELLLLILADGLNDALGDILVWLGELLNDELLLFTLADGLNDVLGNGGLLDKLH